MKNKQGEKMIYATSKNLYIEDEGNKKLIVGGAKSDGYFYPNENLKRTTPQENILKEMSAVPVFVENAKPHLVETVLTTKNSETLIAIHGLNPVTNTFEPLFLAHKTEDGKLEKLETLDKTKFFLKNEGKYNFFNVDKARELLAFVIKTIRIDDSLTDVRNNKDFIEIFATFFQKINNKNEDVETSFENVYFLNKIINLLKENGKEETIEKIMEEGKALGMNETFLNDIQNGVLQKELNEIGEVKEGKNYVESLKDEIADIKKRIQELNEDLNKEISEAENIVLTEKKEYFEDKLKEKEKLLGVILDSIEKTTKNNPDVITFYEIPSKKFYVDTNKEDFYVFLQKNFFNGIDEKNIYKITDSYSKNLSSKIPIKLDQILHAYIKEKFFSDIEKESRKVVNYEIVGQGINNKMFYYKQQKYIPVTFYDKLDIIENLEEEIEKDIKLNKIESVIGEFKEDKQSFEKLIALNSVLMQMKNEIIPSLESDKPLTKEDFKNQREELAKNPKIVAQLKEFSTVLYKTAESLKKAKVPFIKYHVLEAIANEAKVQAYYLNRPDLNEETLNKVLNSINNVLKGFSFAINAYKDFYAYKFDGNNVFQFTKEGTRLLGKGGVEIPYEEFKKLNYTQEINIEDYKKVYEPLVAMGIKLNPSKNENNEDILKYGLIPIIGVKADIFMKKDFSNISDEDLKQYIINLKNVSNSGINSITKLAYNLQNLNKNNFREYGEAIIQNLEYLISGAKSKKKEKMKALEELKNISDVTEFKEKALDLVPELKKVFDNLPDLSFTVEASSLKETKSIENIFEAKTITYVKEILEHLKNKQVSFKKGYEQTPLPQITAGDFTYPAYSKKPDENGRKKYLGRYMKFFINDDNKKGEGKKNEIAVEAKINEEKIKEILQRYGYAKHNSNTEAFKIRSNKEWIESLTGMYLSKESLNEKHTADKTIETDKTIKKENNSIKEETDSVPELNEEYIPSDEISVNDVFNNFNVDEMLPLGEEENYENEEDSITTLFSEDNQEENLFAHIKSEKKSSIKP